MVNWSLLIKSFVSVSLSIISVDGLFKKYWTEHSPMLSNLI